MPSKSYKLPYFGNNRVPEISTISVESHTKKNEQKSDKVVSYEDALQQIGFGKVQVQLVCIASLLLFAVIDATMGISFIIPAAHCDLKLSTSDKGLLSSTGFFGKS